MSNHFPDSIVCYCPDKECGRVSIVDKAGVAHCERRKMEYTGIEDVLAIYKCPICGTEKKFKERESIK